MTDDESTKLELKKRLEQLEKHVYPNRRDVLKGAAGAGIGLAAGVAATGNAAAGSQSAGTWGTQNKPQDGYVEDLYDHNGNNVMSFPGDGSVSIEAVWNGSDILLIGTSGQLIERRDPSQSATPVTTAINDLDSVGGGEIHLPPGTINDDGPLPVADNVHVYGRGHGGGNATVVNITGGGKGIHLSSTAGTTRHGSFERFRLANGDGLGGQSNGDSIAMHLESTIRGFDINLRFDDWANEVIRSDAACFENRWRRIYAQGCDGGNVNALFNFDTIGPANTFQQVIGYPTDGVSASDSTILRINGSQEVSVHSLNVGGTADWALWNNSGVGHFGPINYEPTGTNSNADRVVHHGGEGTAVYSEVTVQGTTVNNIFNLNGGGAVIPVPYVDAATVNGNRVYVNTDVTTPTTYHGNSADVNNATGATLTQPVTCLGDLTQVT